MNVLLIAPPRSASKWLYGNLAKYYSEHHILTKTGGSMVVVDRGSRLEFRDSGKDRSYLESIENLLEIATSTRLRVLTKLHPIKYIEGSKEAQIRDELCELHEVIIQVTRKDHFGRCLSRLICNKTGVWAPGASLEAAQKDYHRKPILGSLDTFKSILKTNDFDIWIHPRAHVVDFEDFKDVRDSRAFCRVFNLPFKDFEFELPVMEHGDKRKIFSNYDDLVAVYNKYVIEIDRPDLIIHP